MKTFNEYIEDNKEYGYIKEFKNPIVRCTGLPGAKIGEVVVFENNEIGVVLSMSKDLIEVISFSTMDVNAGQKIARSGSQLEIKVGDYLMGKLVSPLMKPLIGEINVDGNSESRRVDIHPSGIIERSPITRQMITGVSLIDVLLPIGMGQRELIVGDRKTGKTHSIINIIKKQAELGTVIVFALIGKERSETRKIQKIFEVEGFKDKSILIASSPADSPSIIDLTPYAAMTVAEYFRDHGRDVLIVFDDLTNHAKFYREISLIAGRFPGRDSYPGDIFYKHARLLERGGNFKIYNHGNAYSATNPRNSSDCKDVAITCLPIGETLNKHLSDYIVSNLIGITDGHLLFDEDTFNEGIRPAIDIFLSVTRVGKQTQSPIMRSLNASVFKLMARYQKSISFKHFGVELSDRAKKIINRGDKIYNFFTQNYKTAIPENIQILMLVMIIGGLFDEFELNDIVSCRDAMLVNYFDENTKKQINEIVGSSSNVKELVEKIKTSKIDLVQLCKISKK